jgi:hypothetical protein
LAENLVFYCEPALIATVAMQANGLEFVISRCDNYDAENYGWFQPLMGAIQTDVFPGVFFGTPNSVRAAIAPSNRARSKLMWLSVLKVSLTSFQAKPQRGAM